MEGRGPDAQEYTDGILHGCEVKVQDQKLVVGIGIVKHHGFA